MDSDRRKGDSPIPDNLQDELTDAQLIALPALERFGWELLFVRRPLFQEVIPVVCNAEGTMVGVLDEDGRLNLELPIQIRSSAADADSTVAPIRAKEK